MIGPSCSPALTLTAGEKVAELLVRVSVFCPILTLNLHLCICVDLPYSSEMPYKTIICRESIPLESIPLGGLVLDVNKPREHYWDPTAEIKPEVFLETYVPSGQQGQTSTTTGENFVRFLTNLVSVALTRQRHAATTVAAEKVTTYRLANCDEWFKSCCQQDATRKWMEKAIIQGNEIYVVVGYHTLSNAQYLGNASEEEGPQDTSTESNNDDEGLQRRINVPGEHICAVQYGRVHFLWFNSSELDQATLDDENLWKFSSGVRGEQSGKNDVLDAIPREDLELEDDLEGFTFDGEGEFFI